MEGWVPCIYLHDYLPTLAQTFRQSFLFGVLGIVICSSSSSFAHLEMTRIINSSSNFVFFFSDRSRLQVDIL